MARPLVSLLTDFGLRDPSAAICRGVILSIAPEAEVLDITHEVPKYSIRDGAYVLWCALPYLPVGSHVAVVDPGVGTARRAVAIRAARGDVLVGPDNGLLPPAAERLGGAVAAHVLAAAAYRLPTVSGSFHGRDIFAPAGAHLARGVPIEALGPSLPVSDLVRLPIPAPRATAAGLETSVVYVDTFGNVKWTALASDLTAALGPLRPGDGLCVELAGGGLRSTSPGSSPSGPWWPERRCSSRTPTAGSAWPWTRATPQPATASRRTRSSPSVAPEAEPGAYLRPLSAHGPERRQSLHACHAPSSRADPCLGGIPRPRHGVGLLDRRDHRRDRAPVGLVARAVRLADRGLRLADRGLPRTRARPPPSRSQTWADSHA